MLRILLVLLVIPLHAQISCFPSCGGGGGGAPIGPAGGALTGTYPNPGVGGFTKGTGTITGPATSGTVSPTAGANGIPQLDGAGNLSIGTTVLPTWVDPRAFGAKGDGKQYLDGSMGSGPTAITWTCGTTCYPSGFIISLRGVNASTPVDVSGGAGLTGTSPVAPSVTTTLANDFLLSVFSLGNAAFTLPTAPPNQILYTPRVGGDEGNWVGGQTIALAGATPTVTATLGSSIPWAAVSIALARAGAGAITYVSGNTKINPSGADISMVPPGGPSGNIYIACVSFFGATTLTTPSGWTRIIAESGTGDQQLFCDWKASASNSPTLTSSTATFTSGDVGKLICVAGVGLSGTELCSSVTSVTGSHDLVVLDSNFNGSPATSLQFRYGTNDDSAISSALAAACGNVLFFAPGNYVSGGLQQTPCTTNSVIIQGSGATLPDYRNVVADQSGGLSASAIWLLSKSLFQNSSLFFFGTGSNSFTTGVQVYRFPQVVRDIAFNAGVGVNLDGGCPTCNGLYFYTGQAVTLENVIISGFGQDGLVLDGTWRNRIASCMFDSNGRFGINFNSTLQPSLSITSQNLGVYDSDISSNGQTGIEINTGGGVTLLNNLIQWNGVITGSSAYEVEFAAVGRSGTSFIAGNWFEGAHGENMLNTSNFYGPDGPLVGGNVLFSGTNPFACVSATSPSVCGYATSGSAAIPTGTNPNLTVNTNAVIAGSRIIITPDSSVGALLGITCNTTLATTTIHPVVTARTAATSFTMSYNGVVTTNPVCVNWQIVN